MALDHDAPKLFCKNIFTMRQIRNSLSRSTTCSNVDWQLEMWSNRGWEVSRDARRMSRTDPNQDLEARRARTHEQRPHAIRHGCARLDINLRTRIDGMSLVTMDHLYDGPLIMMDVFQVHISGDVLHAVLAQSRYNERSL